MHISAAAVRAPVMALRTLCRRVRHSGAHELDAGGAAAESFHRKFVPTEPAPVPPLVHALDVQVQRPLEAHRRDEPGVPRHLLEVDRRPAVVPQRVPELDPRTAGCRPRARTDAAKEEAVPSDAALIRVLVDALDGDGASIVLGNGDLAEDGVGNRGAAWSSSSCLLQRPVGIPQGATLNRLLDGWAGIG